jgi:uncharacterized phage protein gp47/JayE
LTTEEYYAALSADFQGRAGLTGDPSTELSIRFYAVAAQLEALYNQCLWVTGQCFPQTATGTYLDNHAQMRGLSRKGAAAATGSIRFLVDQAAATDLDIPAGTVCMTAGLVQFETTQAATLKAGKSQVDVPAQAVESGSQGNVAAGTVLTMSVPPVGISACTNPEPFQGGLDEEDDDALRARVLATYARMSNGANTAYYEQAALEFDGVAAVSVIGRNRGIGTVDVIIVGEDGVPTQTLVDQVQTYFDDQREIAVDVKVLSPTTTAVPVNLLVQVSDSADPDEVLPQVRQVITDYFNGTLLGKGISRGKLYALAFQVDGVENCSLLDPNKDIAAQQDVLPVLGTLTVSEWDGES